MTHTREYLDREGRPIDPNTFRSDKHVYGVGSHLAATQPDGSEVIRSFDASVVEEGLLMDDVETHIAYDPQVYDLRIWSGDVSVVAENGRVRLKLPCKKDEVVLGIKPGVRTDKPEVSAVRITRRGSSHY